MKKKQNQTKNKEKAKTTKAENTILIRVRVSKSNHNFFFFSPSESPNCHKCDTIAATFPKKIVFFLTIFSKTTKYMKMWKNYLHKKVS